MKKLLIYLKSYRKESFLAPLFKMLEAAFDLLVPLVIRDIIDVGIPSGKSAYLLSRGLLLVLLAITGFAMATTAQYFAARAAAGFAANIRRALMAHIGSLGYREIDSAGTSTLITRMTSDVNQVQSGTNLLLRLFMRSPFIVFGAVVMAFTIDARAAVIFVVIVPLLSAVVFGIMLASIPLFRKVQTKLDAVTSLTRENLTGVRVLRAFGREEEEISRFQEANSDLIGVQLFVGKISALLNPLTFMLINAATLFLVWTGAWRVEGGILTQGAVVALVNYMAQILVELIKLANLFITVTKAVACGNRIQTVLETEPSIKEGTQETALSGTQESGVPAVEFAHVSLTYPQAGAKALTDIDFTAKPGEVIGVIGGTGSGKTSLVNLIPRFYEATEGEVRVFGRPVSDYRFEALRSMIGIVPQKAVLFRGTIRENLQWGKEKTGDEELLEALKTAQAMDIVEKKEGGLDAMIEQGGRNLSGGQRQRLTIARALVRKPKILILDDSASALDYATDAALRSSIREMPDSPTLFIVSQRTASIRYADQILVLDEGAVVGQGTHESLMESCPVYQEIYRSQYGQEEGGEANGRAEE